MLDYEGRQEQGQRKKSVGHIKLLYLFHLLSRMPKKIHRVKL